MAGPLPKIMFYEEYNRIAELKGMDIECCYLASSLGS